MAAPDAQERQQLTQVRIPAICFSPMDELNTIFHILNRYIDFDFCFILSWSDVLVSKPVGGFEIAGESKRGQVFDSLWIRGNQSKLNILNCFDIEQNVNEKAK